MVNKPKLNEPDLETTFTATGESLTINMTIPTKQFKDIFVTGTSVINQQSNLTFDECIKEWEERGWKVEISTSTIKLDYIKFGRLSGIHIYKGLKEVRILYENLHYEEFHLLSKTIKALEETKDE